MAKVFYVSPGRSYTVTAAEGTTITYPGVTIPAATVGASGSVTFNCTGTEITVSDDSAQIAQNFNNAGAAVAGAGEGSGGAPLEGVALLEGGNSFSGNQNIEGDVVIEGSVTISGDVTAEGEYNGAEIIETSDTTIIPEAGKYYKYTGTGDTITVANPVWNGYMTISYLETTIPVDLQGVTWSPAKPSLTGAGPFVYTLVSAASGSVLASAMNYSVATAEAIQAVAPIAWSIGDSGAKVDTNNDGGIAIGRNAHSVGNQGIVIGAGSYSHSGAIAIGSSARAGSNYVICIGRKAFGESVNCISIGNESGAPIGVDTKYHIAIGTVAKVYKSTAITIGSQFTETVDGQNVTHTCITEGTGSITIGAGANTLNTTTTINGSETTVESSNAVTIGCKAENKGADSVVIGAGASGQGGVIIGAEAIGNDYNSIAIGLKSRADRSGIAIGENSYAPYTAVNIGNSTKGDGTSIGYSSQAYVHGVAIGSSSFGQSGGTSVGYHSFSTGKGAALGFNAQSRDAGAIVFASWGTDDVKTQLYFSGANTPLANTYEGGEAMMGYVVRDSAGNIMTDAEGNAMVGTQKLSVLFPNNRGENAFTPTPAGLDEEYIPKPMFRPSDLDMLPQEELTEPESVKINIMEPTLPETELEEYTPLPVYPIMEPEIPSEL